MAQMRLDRILSDMGVASRKELKQIIKAGRVTVNGCAVCVPEQKADPEKDMLCFDGRQLFYTKYHYYIMNKPAGILTATEDRKQKTVLDLLSAEEKRLGLFPVGRLDKDTTGLLLITDDGDYAHRVISPKSAVEKMYYAIIDGSITESDIRAFRDGIVLADGTHCMPALLERANEKGDHVRVVVTEGKYHQVKRMLASRGKPVTELHRLSIGELMLDEGLAPGEYSELAQTEAMKVFSSPNLIGTAEKSLLTNRNKSSDKI